MTLVAAKRPGDVQFLMGLHKSVAFFRKTSWFLHATACSDQMLLQQVVYRPNPSEYIQIDFQE